MLTLLVLTLLVVHPMAWADAASTGKTMRRPASLLEDCGLRTRACFTLRGVYGNLVSWAIMSLNACLDEISRLDNFVFPGFYFGPVEEFAMDSLNGYVLQTIAEGSR